MPQTTRSNREISHDDEHALIARLRHGDSHAFRFLVTHFANRLARFAFHMVGSRDAAEDVVQQVFVHVWEHRAALQLGSLKSYLFAAVRNRALNERRADTVRSRYREAWQGEAKAGVVTNASPSPEGAILTSAMVEEAIAQLPGRRQLAVRLRLEEEMTNAEIADVLDISIAATKQLVARALHDVRALLARE